MQGFKGFKMHAFSVVPGDLGSCLAPSATTWSKDRRKDQMQPQHNSCEAGAHGRDVAGGREGCQQSDSTAGQLRASAAVAGVPCPTPSLASHPGAGTPAKPSPALLIKLPSAPGQKVRESRSSWEKAVVSGLCTRAGCGEGER